MNVQFITTLIVLGLLGVADAIYLIFKSREKKQLVCPIGDDCSKVLDSTWNKIFFIKNDILGLLFYVGIIIGAILLLLEFNEKILTILTIGSGIGVFFSGFLVFIQAKIIKNYCFYCLISAFINVLIFLNLLFL